MVQRWLRRQHRCFRTAINRGLSHSRIDVVGVRDVGGDLSGDVETIAIEVKKGNAPFATASGQTLGYNVYANRIYLADVRRAPFSIDELNIASRLGIGLIQIRRGKCCEVLSSPFHDPIRKLNLLLLEKLRLGRCQLCGSFFEAGDAQKSHGYSNLSRENVNRAIRDQKGLIFWNREVADRKRRLRVRASESDATYERRFICPDCVHHVVAQLRRET